MNQHYVPQVYLKNFAKAKGKEYYVNVYDKLNDKYFETNIKNICSETNLYTLDKNNKVAKHTLVVEKIYSDFIEPMYARVYNILTNDKIVQITNLQRAEIIIGLFQFYYRNPIIFRKTIDVHLENINELYHKAKRESKKGLTYLEEDFSFREFSLEEIQNFFINKLFNLFKEQHIRATSELGVFHEFTVIEVERIVNDSSYFLTNDNPLYFVDVLSKTENPFLKSNEFSIPINKKYRVKIFHDNTKRVNHIYRDRALSGDVQLINDDIFNKGYRFIIGERTTFSELKKAKEFLDSTTLDNKIGLIEQIINNKYLSDRSKEGTEILQHFYNRYKENKTLTKQEEYEMMMKINELNRETKRKKI